jgi:hypothetical protein
VVGGLGERADALGLGARAHGGRQRARVVASAQPMMRDLGGDGGCVAAGEIRPPLQRSGEGAVQPRALAGEQLAVRRLAEQGVAEREAVAGRDEHVLAHRAAQRVGQVGLAEVG